jgi:hypothetical protein
MDSRLLHTDLARFAGGSAATEPLGLLAIALRGNRVPVLSPLPLRADSRSAANSAWCWDG